MSKGRRMKHRASSAMVILALGLFACKPSTDTRERGATDTVAVRADSSADSSTDTQPVAAPATDMRDECVRGQAQPIVRKSVFPNTRFTLDADSLTGTETVEFDNGDRLTIQNQGCEYFILTFRFETSRFREDAANIPYWYRQSAVLASEIRKGVDAPFALEQGVERLIRHIELDKPNDYANLKYGQEIDYGGTDIRSYVTLDKVEKLSDSAFAITMSFTDGPL